MNPYPAKLTSDTIIIIIILSLTRPPVFGNLVLVLYTTDSIISPFLSIVNSCSVESKIYPFGASISLNVYVPYNKSPDSAYPLASVTISAMMFLSVSTIANLAPSRALVVPSSNFNILHLPFTKLLIIVSITF